tara:strand:+ start:3616 stop:4287 length:672 start_codon:yes stop_codon:yes gene_type:complete
MQRIFDIIFSLAAIIALLPIFFVVILILKFTGEGEIFYLQERIGLKKKKIYLIKFATMVKNSENIGTGTLTLHNDPRILPFGKFLRRSKINELPQLFNILFGDMSVIGPRPQTQRCFDAFPKKYQDEIVSIVPGLSGVGSIFFRNEDKMTKESDNPSRFYDEVIMPYKAEIEIWYIKNRNVKNYFYLIIQTLVAVLFPSSKFLNKLYNSLPEPPEPLKKYILN